MVPIQRRIVWVVLFALSMLVGGCANRIYKSYTAYEGPPRPAEEIAVLYCERRCGKILDPSEAVHDLRHIAHFWSTESFDDIYLEPGEYKVTILYWFRKNIYSSNQYTSYIPINFEAGHTYRILQEHDCELLFFGGEDTADVWIKDETTDTIVAERHGLRHNCN